MLKSRREMGQGFFEFSLILPVLLLLVLGVIEMGRLMFIFVAVTTTSRESARYGATVGNVPGVGPRYSDCAGIRAAASGLGNLIGIQPANITVSYDGGPGTSVFATCPVGGSGPGNVELGDRIVVSVIGNYSPIVPIVPVPPFPITSSTARTILEDVPIGTAAVVPTNTVTPTPNLPHMWVSGLSIVVIQPNPNKYAARATITISDGGGVLAGATVEGVFSGSTGGTFSGVTNSSGQVQLTSPSKNNSWSGWTFCVTKVLQAAHNYIPSLNMPNPACVSVSFSATATPTRTPTRTPTPTATQTPSRTPTLTPTFTNTPTPTQTPTPTASRTNTPGPSPTATRTITPGPSVTSTPTATNTPTPGPTPICNYTFGSLQVISANAIMSITNNTGATRRISSISMQNWPGVPSNQRVQAIYFGGPEIWSGNSNNPPTFINSGWTLPDTNRDINSGATKQIVIEFRFDVQSGLVSLQVTFNDGCVISGSRP